MPGCNTASYKRLQRVLPCKCNYTAHGTKQRTGLYRGVSCDCTHSTAHDTSPTKTVITPTAPRWSVSQSRNTFSTYQIPDATPGRCTGQHSRPIIIRYKKGCSISQTMPARRGLLLPCADRWQVLHPAHLLRGQRFHLCRVSPAASRCFPRPAPSTRRVSPSAGRRGTIDGYRRISFRAFAR